METEKKNSSLGIVIALIIGLLAGYFLAPVISSTGSRNQGAFSLDSETAKEALTSKTQTIDGNEIILTNEELLILGERLGVKDGGIQERAGWLCRFLGGSYLTPPEVNEDRCYFFRNYAFRVSSGGPIEEVEIDGAPFSQLTDEQIYKISEEKGFSNDPNARPGWLCRLLGGTFDFAPYGGHGQGIGIGNITSCSLKWF